MTSPRRKELYRYLETCQRREGRFPSYREIAAALGWKSTNTVAYHVDRLVREGLLEKEPGKVRSFRLCRYRRSRYVRKQVEEFEVRSTGGDTAPKKTVWLDRGWFGDSSLEVWEATGETLLPADVVRGDCLVLDTAAEPAPGDLILVATAGEVVAGRLFFEGSSLRLLVTAEPEVVLILGEGSLVGDVLGRVVGLLRRL